MTFEQIARVQLRRNVSNQIVRNQKYRVELYLSSEFHEKVDLRSKVTYTLALLHHNNKVEETAISYEIVAVKASITVIELTINLFPESTFQLLFEGWDDERRYWIIPFVSDYFEVIASDQINQSIGLPSLKNYRILKVPKDHDDSSLEQILWVKEEYGLTIGSHVYDSAIILVEYLAAYSSSVDQIRAIDTFKKYSLELGAGCGLVSIFCIKFLQLEAIVTDREEQLSLLQDNIHLNEISSQARIISFDWNKIQQLQSLESLLQAFQTSSSLIEYILAADVLYDASIIQLFFQILIRLFHCVYENGMMVPKVWIAQKNRANLPVEEIRNELMGYYNQLSLTSTLLLPIHQRYRLGIECLYQHCNVVIWDFKFLLT